jgi:GTP-binding protein
VGQGQVYPAPLACEIAIVGRSNVGKSSLINCICNNKKLAKTSQTPGKTRLINYFLINREFFLVDLPGYGFARASKTEQRDWGKLIGDYLASGRPKHLFLLLDIRHAPSAEDRQMFEWVLYYGVPFTLIATKADKLSRANRVAAANKTAKLLGAPPFAIPFSAQSKDGRNPVIERIGQIVADGQKQV